METFDEVSIFWAKNWNPKILIIFHHFHPSIFLIDDLEWFEILPRRLSSNPTQN